MSKLFLFAGGVVAAVLFITFKDAIARGLLWWSFWVAFLPIRFLGWVLDVLGVKL